MDPRLLDAYLSELRFNQALAEEFARDHPKIAARLGMIAGSIGDPYVNRLLESSAFVNARMQLRFDDEFTLFTQALLSSAYPGYLSSTPSIAIARLYPGGKAGGFATGYTLERGTELSSLNLPSGETTACTFRTTQDVSFYPVVMHDGRLTHVPPDLQGQSRYVPPDRQVRGALRLRLRTIEGVPFSALRGLDRLQVYLAGDERIASHLHELIHTGAVVSVIGEPGRFSEASYRPHIVRSDAVVQDGLGPDQAVLPLVARKFLGHNLVQEYFACPARFYFFTLTGLEAGLARIDGDEAEIIVLLDRATSELAPHVDVSTFALFCVPVVNLFKVRTAPAKLKQGDGQVRLVPVEHKPLDYEVHSVELAIGQADIEEDSEELPFYPLHDAQLRDEAGHGRYFTVRSEQHLSTAKGRSYDTRAPYISTDSYLSLVGRDGLPYAPNTSSHNGEDGRINYLSLDAWLTNRDLPGRLQCNGVNDLSLPESAPFSSVGLVRVPSRSMPPLAAGRKAWQMYAQLNIEYAHFDDPYDEPNPGEGLRSMLRLYAPEDRAGLARQVESLTAATLTPVNCVMAGSVPPVVRALECAITFDEDGFDGVSPYALGLVLEHYLARHVSGHSYTRTLLQSTRRGRIAEWPPRAGARGAI
ncbi:type VI secretion system baseplate subunit TssF [Caballeronia novacaledonica]|uniref:Type VI secretion system baseplate subunit TssF n=1 Tax=Caballeronia novacaledonica TaxID=1544861 RepID=A0AA37MJI1_9BURK|nr:type VI secretion system baseplate subunit TssF [Caballeronia novacaledonica]GJH29608.1 type VI secretion system baseplate subunit TssF [Caballeronia novacaledonica]